MCFLKRKKYINSIYYKYKYKYILCIYNLDKYNVKDVDWFMCK